MSLPLDSLDPIPEETARIAQRAFPRGSLALRLRETLGSIYHDGMFADLYPSEGQPGIAPWRLALVTVLQYAENLPDRQAAEAVRGRIDWKYALALPLDHPGFDHSVLSTFRDRLLAGQAEDRLLWALLDACEERGLLRKRGQQRTDSTHVLAAVRHLNRLELVGEALHAALEVLAVAAPAWIIEQIPPAWSDRYGRRMEGARLPEGAAGRQALAEQIGQDGQQLLRALQAALAPGWLQQLPAVQRLQQIWSEQYIQGESGIRWRTPKDLPPGSEQCVSPYDGESRWAEKHQTRWVGSKVHLTESCDPDLPHLLLQVTTTHAAVDDHGMLPLIWQDLTERDILPSVHLADAGYVEAAALVTASHAGIELIGPVQRPTSWQERETTGYAATDFAVDWTQEGVQCPQGKQSHTWVETKKAGKRVVRVRFASADCDPCPVRSACTRSATSGRTLTLQPTRELYEARQAALERQTTDGFRARYRIRAGIEGTISQAVRRTGLRSARYRRADKLHLQHCAEATAINLYRLDDWYAGTPRAQTRHSHLTQLLAPAA